MIFCKKDEMLNPQGKEEVQKLRSMINTGPILKRFLKTPKKDEPKYIIIDVMTDRKTEVPLYAVADVMRALEDLFEESEV